MKREEQHLNQFSSTLSPKTRAAFDEFKRVILQLQPHVDQDVCALATKQNMKGIRSASILFLLINIYYLITDLSRGFYQEPYAYLNLIAILLMLIPSAVMLILTITVKNHGRKRIRIANLIYYICVVTAVFLFTVSYTIRADLFYEGQSDFVGVTTSTCYVFFLMCAPLPKRLDTAILLSYSAVLFLMPVIIPTIVPGYDPVRLFTMFLFIVFGYFYLRNLLLQSSERELRTRKKNDSLLELAYFDFLTATFSKRALDRYWKHISESKTPPKKVGVILFDIDNFKSYNDNYSHMMGDKILSRVLRHLNDTLTEHNKYLFRYGGEEFVMLLIDPTEDELRDYGLRIKNEVYGLALPRSDIPFTDRVTVSVGCSIIDPSEQNAIDFISDADSQLIIAKASDKNCVAMNGKIYV